jgi:predicted NBD/HSP70 family sugar kinase
LTETQVVGALTDLEATVVAKRTSPLGGHAPDEVAASLADAVRQLVRDGRVPLGRLLGVGIGLAGIVDGDAGLLRQSPFFGWRDVPLRSLLQDLIRAPVSIDNDVNTLTIAEKWFGAGQGVQDFLTVTIGRGVGLGIVANGQFYRGARGGAGEFGHTVIDAGGPPCACGKRGCLETFVGDPALVRMAQERGLAAAGPAELISLAASGDRRAGSVLAGAGEVFGRAVANLINLLDPALIIISGEGVRAGEWLFGPMRSSIRAHVMPGLAEDAVIRIHAWDDDAWARGASSLVLRELFESPIHRSPVEAQE